MTGYKDPTLSVLLEDYCNKFEKIKFLENPKQKEKELQNLLKEYRNNDNIHNMASGFAHRGNVENIQKITGLEHLIAYEIIEPRIQKEITDKKMNGLVAIRHKIIASDNIDKESRYKGYFFDAASIGNGRGSITQEDLDKFIGVDSEVV